MQFHEKLPLYTVAVHNLKIFVYTADGSVRVWDSTQPAHTSAVCINSSGGGEVLACDWSKYDHHNIVSTGVDAVIRCVVCVCMCSIVSPLLTLFPGGGIYGSHYTLSSHFPVTRSQLDESSVTHSTAT